MKQKTPLALLEQWLEDYVGGNLHRDILAGHIIEKIQELKAIEKEQMIDMWERGAWNHIWQETRTDYFNENYEQ